MITRVEIDGFKSFKDFSIDLEPIVAVVGPNSAGKSNLFEALQLISRLSSTGSARDALSRGRGLVKDQFRRAGASVARKIRLAVELLVSAAVENVTHTRLRYEVVIERIELDNKKEEVFIAGEVVTPIQREADEWMARHAGLTAFARYSQRKRFLSVEQNMPAISEMDPELSVPEGPHVHVVDWGYKGADQLGPGGTGFGKLTKRPEGSWLVSHQGAFGPHLRAVVRELQAWRFLRPDLRALRLKSDAAASSMLEPDASNLPTALASVSQEIRAVIQADLVNLIPGMGTVEVIPDDDGFSIEIEQVDGTRMPARLLSDGTMRILAFLTFLHAASGGAVAGVEEPENGIFPGRLQALIHRLFTGGTERDNDLPVQVILNSHSPAILAALHNHPLSVVYADMVQRGELSRSTRMRRMRASPGGDRATTVSQSEIERILHSARPEEAA
jgi:predicted ATPase